jgi:hypothetical protein
MPLSSIGSREATQPNIAEEWEDDNNQLVIVKCSLEVPMKNARDSSDHSTTGALYAEHVADQADRVARFKP